MNYEKYLESNSKNFGKYMESRCDRAMFKRAYPPLDRYLEPNKAMVIYGPRRSGKTTLLLAFLE